MRSCANCALEEADHLGAEYADFRMVEQRVGRLYVRDRSIKSMGIDHDSGYSVRVLKNGAWGLASSTNVTHEEVARTARRAIEVAGASAVAPKDPPATVVPESPHEATQRGSCEQDPFDVPDDEKAELLLQACEAMLGREDIARARAALRFIRRRRTIGTTDGTFVDLTNTFTEPILEATAVIGGESQTRSFQGGARQAGYEYIREVDILHQAERLADEAVLKARAEETPEGIMDLVLDPENLALTMHESVGHPTESDRILGWEANMAGRSFVRPSDIGSLRYGSDIINFTVDNTMEEGLGSWFYDDEGVPMQKFPLIRRGVLQDVSLTRETAALLGRERSNGCCRSDSFAHFPINRIPNLYLEPGPDAGIGPEDLIADVERGIYIAGRGSWSIDQMRRNFQFGGDMFWMIEDGRLVHPLKKVTYQSQTTDFWQSCDELAGPDHWRAHGVMNCGKGEPTQVMFMTHGASYGLFREIEVGGSRR
jgi:TldD protein